MKPVKKLKDLLFTCQYENKTLKQILFENQLERWVPGCTYSYTEKEHLARYRWVAKFVRNKSIVDIACGAGKGSYILASLGKAKKVIAGDIDQDTLKYASLKYFHPKIKYINI